MSTAEKTVCGVLIVHSTPRVLAQQLEWTVSSCLGEEHKLPWRNQPAVADSVQTELYWKGRIGAGALIASALRGWEQIRFEVTEEPTPSSEGSRWMSTPRLGIHHSRIDSAGNALVTEDQIRSVIGIHSEGASRMVQELLILLGKPWDDELDAFRSAGESSSIAWLDQNLTGKSRK